MKRILLSMGVILVTTIYSHAQNDPEPIHTGVANFLTIPSDARTLGMGGANVALTHNNNPALYNGAGIFFGAPEKSGVSYGYTPWMRDYESGHHLHSIGGYHTINNRNAVYAGLRYYGYPKLQVFEGGQPAGKHIRPSEWAIDLGYARKISNKLALAATLRFIYSDMGNIGGAKSAKAVAMDISALYADKFPGIQGAKWTAGIQLSNFGSELKYLDKKEKLPTMGKLGGTVCLPIGLAHQITVAADLGYRMLPSDVQSIQVSSGLEYTLLNHILFRGGYHYGDKNKGDWSYASAGAGVTYQGALLDFSWLFAESNSPIKNTFSISCGVNF